MITLLEKSEFELLGYAPASYRERKRKLNEKFKKLFEHDTFKKFENKGNGSHFKINDLELKSVGKYSLGISTIFSSWKEHDKYYLVYINQDYSTLESLVYDEVNELLIINNSIAIKTKLEKKNG